jgi:toxin ParE1/3/4
MAAPRRPVSWAPEAAAELSDIWDYYALAAGPPVANAIVERIRDVCRILDEHPLAGRSREEIRPGLRCLVASPHVIFYRVRDSTAEILRIVDGRRDIDEIFDETQKSE